jgi:hypothetical protein
MRQMGAMSLESHSQSSINIAFLSEVVMLILLDYAYVFDTGILNAKYSRQYSHRYGRY